MADGLYNRGLDEWKTWQSDTFMALLLKGSGYTFNKDHDFVDDLTPASNEVTVSAYVRPVLTTCTRTVDDTNDRITYDCDDPTFGILIPGETVSAMVIYRLVNDDTDSILMGYYDLPDTATASSLWTVTIAATGAAYLDAA